MIRLVSFLFSLIISGLLVSCSTHGKEVNLDTWIGKYKYDETPIKSSAGYSMVMTWDLLIEKNNKSYTGVLEVNGQQTFLKLLTNVIGDSTHLAIVYDKLIDGSNENLKTGDTLFTITTTGKELKTRWFLLEPRLAEYPPRECVCFESSLK